MSAAHAKKSIEFVRVIKDLFYAIWLPYLYAQVYFLGKEIIVGLKRRKLFWRILNTGSKEKIQRHEDNCRTPSGNVELLINTPNNALPLNQRTNI